MALILGLLRNRLLVPTATLLLVVGGLIAWYRLPIDAFPDVTNTQVMVLTKAPGFAAINVEQRVSYPIERVIRGLPPVRQIRSLSKAELSQFANLRVKKAPQNIGWHAGVVEATGCPSLGSAGATSAASRAINTRGESLIEDVPSDQGFLNSSFTFPSKRMCSRPLASGGRAT